MGVAMLEAHDLGDCEGVDGFLCDECRIEYSSRWDDLDQQDYQDEKHFTDKFEGFGS